MKRLTIAGLLATAGMYLAWLWYTGALNFYILPRFGGIVLATGIIFMGLAAALLFWKKGWHNIEHHVPTTSLLPFVLLLACIFFVAPQSLSSVSLEQRGADLDLSNVKVTATKGFIRDSSKRTFSDWVNILGSSHNPRKYEDDAVRVKGFVYRTENMPEDEFYAARFLVRCCSADASPIVLRVKYANAAELQNDTWVDITGVIAHDQNPEQPVYIDMQSYDIIDMPKIPYIY